MKYKFLKGGNLVDAIYAETEEEATKKCNLSKDDYDKIEIENEVIPQETKTRKPRSDKGKTKANKKPSKSRRKPDYFIYQEAGGLLSPPLSRAEAEDQLSLSGSDKIRLIAGREIAFTRKISFKFKG